MNSSFLTMIALKISGRYLKNFQEKNWRLVKQFRPNFRSHRKVYQEMSRVWDS